MKQPGETTSAYLKRLIDPKRGGLRGASPNWFFMGSEISDVPEILIALGDAVDLCLKKSGVTADQEAQVKAAMDKVAKSAEQPKGKSKQSQEI